MVGTLAHGDLDVRLVEALPWVLSAFPELEDCGGWLVAQCRVLNLQNRLGYVVTLADGGEVRGAAVHLRRLLGDLEASRLAGEERCAVIPCRRPSASGFQGIDAMRPNTGTC